jgi:hypothetical protein
MRTTSAAHLWAHGQAGHEVPAGLIIELLTGSRQTGTPAPRAIRARKPDAILVVSILIVQDSRTQPHPRLLGDARPSRLCRCAPHSQDADAVVALGAVRDAFGGRATVASTDLVARLAADPGRYGSWDFFDPGAFLAAHGTASRRVPSTATIASGWGTAWRA